MTEIRLNQLGYVISGDEPGTWVKIEYDPDDTGGYFILVSPDKFTSVGFDDWVVDRPALEEYFERKKWVVEWVEEEH